VCCTTTTHKRTRCRVHAHCWITEAPSDGRSCWRWRWVRRTGQKTSGIVRTIPTKGTSGSVIHCPAARVVCRDCRSGATLRFAGMVEDPLFGRRGLDLSTQGRCAAGTNLAEVGPHCVALGGAVPLVPGKFEDLPQRMFRMPLLGLRSLTVGHAWSSPWPVRACRSRVEISRTSPAISISATRMVAIRPECFAASALMTRSRSVVSRVFRTFDLSHDFGRLLG